MRQNIFPVIVLALFGSSQAFQQGPSLKTATTPKNPTRLYESIARVPVDISYGEESRKYRRTVFSHDDWRRFRNPERFGYSLASMFQSGIYKGIGREVSATTLVAAFVVVFNAIVGGYTDFDGVQHPALISSSLLPMIGLPLAPFTLSSPSLGLLLGMSCHARS